MRIDNLIPEIIELKSNQGFENYEFDPTFIIVMQLASTIGMSFDLKTLFKLMPIDIVEVKLLEILHDLCDLNVFFEFEQDSEFCFESSFLKDVV